MKNNDTSEHLLPPHGGYSKLVTYKLGLRIADNKTGEIAEWDYSLLPLELQELQEANFDLSLLGFDADELDKLLNGEAEEIAEGETEPDAVPEVPEIPSSRAGEIYQLGDHLLMCGDATNPDDVAALMGNRKRVNHLYANEKRLRI